MLFDLGLHEDCSELVKHGILSMEDADLRDELFLSAFAYDRLWALYLGRPSCVPLVALEQRQISTSLGQQPITLTHWVNLCNLISEVSEILNGFGVVLDKNTVGRLCELSARIAAVHQNLAPELSHQADSELHVTAYGLNMQFCGIQIVLNRALVKILIQNAGEGSWAHNAQVDKSRSCMYENAVSICRLGLAYREIFGVENFITIMLDNMYIAASTLISHILQPPEADCSTVPSTVQLLRTVAETMEALRKHYAVAGKMLRTLSRITENTTIAGMFGIPDSQGSAPEDMIRHPMGSFISPAVGSWGSMEALVHDDFILSQANMFGDAFGTDSTLADATWMPNIGMGLVS